MKLHVDENLFYILLVHLVLRLKCSRNIVMTCEISYRDAGFANTNESVYWSVLI